MPGMSLVMEMFLAAFCYITFAGHDFLKLLACCQPPANPADASIAPFALASIPSHPNASPEETEAKETERLLKMAGRRSRSSTRGAKAHCVKT